MRAQRAPLRCPFSLEALIRRLERLWENTMNKTTNTGREHSSWIRRILRSLLLAISAPAF